MAAAALERSINANLLRRWVVEAERAEGGIVPSRALPAPPAAASKGGFVSVPMLPKISAAKPIKVEIRRGAFKVRVQWPSSAAHEGAMWLREVVK
jgi:transposase